MITVSKNKMDDNDFDNLYNSRLLPVMDQLRAECRKGNKWATVGLLSFVAFMVVMYFGMMAGKIPYYGIYCVPLFALAIASLVMYTSKRDAFTDDYKKLVINEIINHLCPGMEYKADECISAQDYELSSLYRYYYDYYSSNDFMSGTIDNVQFLFSELWTQYDDYRRHRTIFKGLFFAIQTNYAFTDSTYAWSRDTVQLAGSIYDEEYRLMPMPDVDDVGFGDKDFENYYRVCSTYPAEATTILTPSLRTKFTEISQLAPAPVSFSFVNGNLYMAIQHSEDLLEPPDRDPDDKEEIHKYYLSVQLIIGIVKNLELGQLV